MLRRVLRHVHPAAEVRQVVCRARGQLRHLKPADVVHTEVPHLLRPVVARQQIILPLRADQRQRMRLPHAPVVVQLPVRAHAAVQKPHLHVRRNGPRQRVHPLKKVPVVRAVPLVHRLHAAQPVRKPRPPHALQLSDQHARLVRGNVPAQQHAVNEHAQLPVGKHRLQIRALAARPRADVIPQLPQQRQVARHRVAPRLHPELPAQPVLDLLDRHRLFLRGMPPQHLQYAQRQPLLAAHSRHARSLLSPIIHPLPPKNTAPQRISHGQAIFHTAKRYFANPVRDLFRKEETAFVHKTKAVSFLAPPRGFEPLLPP